MDHAEGSILGKHKSQDASDGRGGGVIFINKDSRMSQITDF